MGNTFYFAWEVLLMQWIQGVSGSVGAGVSSFFTMLGEELILVTVLGFIYWCYDKEFGKYIGYQIVVGIVWNPIFKNIALRRRPYFDHPGIKCLKPVKSGADIYDISAQGFSFPSGHSTNAAVAYGGISVYKKKKIISVICIIIIVLVGLSRVVLGVHYPTDVLFGWAMGGVIVLFAPFLQRKVQKRRILYLFTFLLSSMGFLYCRTNDYYTSLGVMAGFFLAVEFEEKIVGFENTQIPSKCVLRLIFGFAVYLGMNKLLKLPFSKELLDSATLEAYVIRFARYAIVTFVSLGVYPMLFKKIKI